MPEALRLAADLAEMKAKARPVVTWIKLREPQAHWRNLAFEIASARLLILRALGASTFGTRTSFAMDPLVHIRGNVQHSRDWQGQGEFTTLKLEMDAFGSQWRD